MDHIGKYYVEPLEDGLVKWQVKFWGVEAEFEQHPTSFLADPKALPMPIKVQHVRIPWRTLTRMLLTRDS